MFHWKKVIVLLCFAASGLSGLFLFLLWTAQPARLEVVDRLDLGKLPMGAYSTVVSIRNGGGRELLIDAVNSSCGCVATTYPRSLAPGEVGSMQVTVAVQQGPGASRLDLVCNDENQSLHTVELAWLGPILPRFVPSTVAGFDLSEIEFQKEIELGYPKAAERPTSITLRADSEETLVATVNLLPHEKAAVDEIRDSFGELAFCRAMLSVPRPRGLTVHGRLVCIVSIGQENFDVPLSLNLNWKGR